MRRGVTIFHLKLSKCKVLIDKEMCSIVEGKAASNFFSVAGVIKTHMLTCLFIFNYLEHRGENGDGTNKD